MTSVATALRGSGPWHAALSRVPVADPVQAPSRDEPPGPNSPSNGRPDKAFDDECVAWLPNLRRYARRLAADGFAAEDLVHDTILCALTNRHRFSTGSNLRAWLFTIMHNQFVNRIRQAARETRLGNFAQSAELACPDQEIRQLLKEVAAILNQLPEDNRQVLLLHQNDGLSYADIARRLNVPHPTVRSRLARARLLLRLAVDGEQPGRPDSPRKPAA
jgi:RNA polymerase sigma-70 factor, ECF subfamily